MKIITIKLTALMMVLVMTFIMIPFVLAVESTASGKCGETTNWTLYSDGVLVIDGDGKMDSAPWLENHREDIKTVIVSGNVESIASGAFENCENLELVSIWRGIGSVGNRAFAGCSKLAKIIFEGGGGVSIANDAFDGVTATVYHYSEWDYGEKRWPAVIEKGFDNAKLTWAEFEDYNNCGENAKYIVTTDGTAIIYGTGKMNDFGHGGNTGILFDERKDIIEAYVLGGITYLGSYAFYNCSNLKSIMLCDALKEIGGSAFNGTGIEEITIPARVEKIGASFQSCAALKKITFCGHRPEIDSAAFAADTLTAYYPDNDPSWDGILSERFQLANVTWEAYDAPVNPEPIPEPKPVDEPKLIANGELTDTLSWAIYDNGDMYFIGEGDIKDFDPEKEVLPWNEFVNQVTYVIIDSGIRRVGNSVFHGFKNLNEIVFLGDAPEFGENAFESITVSAFFYIGTKGWTDETLQNYGGWAQWFITTVLGDVTFDGEVSNADLVQMARYNVGLVDGVEDVENIQMFGDLNLDNSIDNQDIVTLARYLVS